MGLPYRCDDRDCIGNGMSSPTRQEIQWNNWCCGQCGKQKYMSESERLDFALWHVDEIVDRLDALSEKVDSILSGNAGL